MTFVKICGITNLPDALVAVSEGADALGFNFYRESSRYVEPLEARRIIEQLPSSVLTVGVFVNEETPEQLKAVASEAGVSAIQLHAMDADYAGKLGVDIDQLLISQPDSGEQALEIAEALVRSNGVDVIVVDSVAALVPRAELDGEMGDSLPGLQARLMSQALRKLTAIVAQSNTCFIFINQIREKIGVMNLS